MINAWAVASSSCASCMRCLLALLRSPQAAWRSSARASPSGGSPASSTRGPPPAARAGRSTSCCRRWRGWATSTPAATAPSCGLADEPCDDCCVHLCCEACALCQEYRELKARGFDMSLGTYCVAVTPACVPRSGIPVRVLTTMSLLLQDGRRTWRGWGKQAALQQPPRPTWTPGCRASAAHEWQMQLGHPCSVKLPSDLLILSVLASLMRVSHLYSVL